MAALCSACHQTRKLASENTWCATRLFRREHATRAQAAATSLQLSPRKSRTSSFMGTPSSIASIKGATASAVKASLLQAAATHLKKICEPTASAASRSLEDATTTERSVRPAPRGRAIANVRVVASWFAFGSPTAFTTSARSLLIFRAWSAPARTLEASKAKSPDGGAPSYNTPPDVVASIRSASSSKGRSRSAPVVSTRRWGAGAAVCASKAQPLQTRSGRPGTRKRSPFNALWSGSPQMTHLHASCRAASSPLTDDTLTKHCSSTFFVNACTIWPTLNSILPSAPL
mmetsp:Transcript_13218/g.38367  ORF Transcript_13218/g.38367 Transcript_13218/m.38367 type:complete len:288 (-) Transcript_13218:1791-2654(-)